MVAYCLNMPRALDGSLLLARLCLFMETYCLNWPRALNGNFTACKFFFLDDYMIYEYK